MPAIKHNASGVIQLPKQVSKTAGNPPGSTARMPRANERVSATRPSGSISAPRSEDVPQSMAIRCFMRLRIAMILISAYARFTGAAA